MSVFPILVARSMLQRGCRVTVVELVQQAIAGRPEQETAALWMRIEGRSYQKIAEELGLNKGSAWRIIQGPIKNTIYSVILSAS